MVSALGAHSPKLDAVRRLRTKRGRQAQGRFAFEGPTLLAEAVRSGFPVEELYATEPAFSRLEPAIREALTCPVFLVSDRALERLSDVETPSGLVAVARFRLLPLRELLAGTTAVLMLAGVADPGNAGTLVRSASAFDVDSVIFADDAVEPYNPKVVRATMGAVFWQRFATGSTLEALDAARAAGFTVVAADRSGVPLGDYRFPERTILAVGHERHGLRNELGRWDAAVAIPQPGRGESLNAAIAGSIVLYEFSRNLSGLSRGLSTRQKP